MSKKNWGWLLLTGASIAAMGGGVAPALAQEASEEIIVTATGRSAAIQDVPLAVTAIGADSLKNAGVADLFNVEQLAPSFRIYAGQSTTTGTVALIRGIGTGSDNPGFEAAVGVFIDGVYRARPGTAMTDLPELERVEVLRGPQGTLFGRNTSAGAISIVTAAPEFSTHAWMEGTVGNLSDAGASVGITGPIVQDKLAGRFEGSLRSRDGYIHDLISGRDVNDQNRWSARGQLLWDISDAASLRIIADAAHTDELCCTVTPVAYGVTQPAIFAISGPASTPALDPEERNLTITPGRTPAESVDDWGVSAQLDWDFGGPKFTSITSYRDWQADRDQDIDFNLIDIAYRKGLEVGFKTFTQEFRLQGEVGRINWLVGAFYGDEKLDTTDRIRLGADATAYINTLALGNTGAIPGGPYQLYNVIPGVPSLFALANPALASFYLAPTAAGDGQQRDNWKIDNRSTSVFTHDEISLTDQLVLTVGARYNHETKDLKADLNDTDATCLSLQGLEFATGAVSGLSAASPAAASLIGLACNPAVNPISNGLWSGSTGENAWSGTASLAYHVSPDLMLYASYSRGFKAGGYNVDRSGFSVTPYTLSPASLNVGQLAFDPEFTDAYEAGFKSTLLGGTTTFNADVFYELIHDYQLNDFNGTNFVTRNVPRTISKGVEVDLLARPTHQLTFQGGVVYNDAYYDSTVAFVTGDPSSTVNEGDTLDHAPKWSVTGAATYTQPISDNLQATFYLDARWNSEYTNQTLSRDPLGRTDQKAFGLLNGRIAIGNPNESWSVELWGRNLTDKFYTVGAFQATLQSGTYVIYPGEPRTYGITLRARY